MIRDSRFHRWRNSQRLVNPAEVVEHVMQRNRMAVIVHFLTESICEPREAAHVHPHG